MENVVDKFPVIEALGRIGRTNYTRTKDGLFAATNVYKNEIRLLNDVEMTAVMVDPNFAPSKNPNRLDGRDAIIVLFADGTYKAYCRSVNKAFYNRLVL